MDDLSSFCTCGDRECPMHPSNHGRGCSPCVAKNLRLGEIPSCFFNMVDSAGLHTSFTFGEFARAVIGKADGKTEDGDRGPDPVG